MDMRQITPRFFVSPQIAPEYEACKRLAESSGLPIAEVYRIIQRESEANLS